MLCWGIVAAPQLDGLDPNGGCIGNGDRNTVGNVTAFADFHAGLVAERHGLFACGECLYMALTVGLVIGNPSLASFSVGLGPSALSDCHWLTLQVRDIRATWGENTAETKGGKGSK